MSFSYVQVQIGKKLGVTAVWSWRHHRRWLRKEVKKGEVESICLG